MRINLRDYREIDPEIEIQGFERYIGAKASGCQWTRMCSDAGYVPSIFPFVAEGVRCQSPVGFLHHQHNRVENSRDRNRSEHSGPYNAIRGREIISENGR